MNNFYTKQIHSRHNRCFASTAIHCAPPRTRRSAHWSVRAYRGDFVCDDNTQLLCHTITISPCNIHNSNTKQNPHRCLNVFSDAIPYEPHGGGTAVSCRYLWMLSMSYVVVVCARVRVFVCMLSIWEHSGQQSAASKIRMRLKRFRILFYFFRWFIHSNCWLCMYSKCRHSLFQHKHTHIEVGDTVWERRFVSPGTKAVCMYATNGSKQACDW